MTADIHLEMCVIYGQNIMSKDGKDGVMYLQKVVEK